MRVRFAFPNRALTDAEKATYVAGGNLPGAVGFDPAVVKFDHKAPDASSTTTLTFPTGIVKETTGQYYYDLDTTPVTKDGDWFYRGYATGTGQAAIEDKFYVEKAF